MNTRILACLIVVTLLALVASAPAREKAETTAKLGMQAPPLEGLEWIKGDPVKIEKGSIYVIEFWATWCPPCRRSIPHLTEVQAEFKDQGVTIIGVSSETAEKVKPFVAEMGDKMNYTVAICPGREVQTAYMTAFGEGGIPHAFIVDKTGALVWHDHPMKNMDAVLKEVVAGTFDPTAFAQKQAAEKEAMEKLQKLYSSYFKAVMQDNDLDQGREIGVELLKSDHTAMLNGLAHTILLKVPEANRDLELAKDAAAKAVKLTEEKEASILDTYAKAMYELSKKYLQEAVVSQKKAVELAGDNKDMKKTLEKYESASID